MTVRRIAIVATALALAACSGDDRKGKSNDNAMPNNANNANNASNNTEDGEPSDGLQPVDGPVDEGSAASVVSDRICDAYEKCRCGEIANVSLANCRQGLQYSWDARAQDARDRGLTYDPDCAAARINAMADRGCAVDQTYYPYCDGETCQVFHGSKGPGEDCDGGFSWSDCQQGLVCIGTCQEPCSNAAVEIPEGGICRDEEQGYIGACSPDLICDPGDGICKSLPGIGEPCLQSQCAEGLWCNAFEGQPAICEPTLPEGRDCRTPLECETTNCTEGVCGPVPAEGEVCTSKCADDLVCAFDGEASVVCTALPTEGEACLQRSVTPCDDGLTCADGTCITKPKLGEPCPPGENGVPPTCEDGSVCGQQLCELTPDAAGCDACAAGDEDCRVFVCLEIPPRVCSDSGGLLY